MYKELTRDQKAHLADQLIDATTQPALKRYCLEIYGDEAYSAEVRVRKNTEGIILNVQVLVWNKDDQLLSPNPTLPYWKKVERETYDFEECNTRMQWIMVADAYLFKRQVPLEYGIIPTSTEQIYLGDIKTLDDIHLYVQDGLPIRTLNLTYPSLSVEEKVPISTPS